MANAKLLTRVKLSNQSDMMHKLSYLATLTGVHAIVEA